MKTKSGFISILAGAVLLASAAACSRPAPPAGPEAGDGGDAQRLVSILDYVGGDYGLAVRDGVVISPAEYEEQVRFVADARRFAERLLGGETASDDPLLASLDRLGDRVASRATPESVAESCRVAREQVVSRFGLRTTPTGRPSATRAEVLYAEACARCHGAAGDADTEQARLLDPPPASFRDPDRLLDLSPYRVYNALTFGVPGTGMAAFDALPPADRWSLAFHVFRLGHRGRASKGPVASPLADLATRSDREILAGLASAGHPDPPAGLAHARLEAPFHEPPMGVGFDETRRLLRRAVEASEQGRADAADGLVLDAYLHGFEPLEPRLAARDPAGVVEIEARFRELRAALSGGRPEAVKEQAGALDATLARLAGGPRPVVPFLAAFLIYLREGIEAALLLGALLASLHRVGRADARRYVHAGWLAALPAGLLTWWLLDRFVALGADRRELVEAAVALLAAAVLFWVSFWMISRVEAHHWVGYLSRRVEESLSRRRLLVLAGLSFLAVYREAAETVLFTQALLFEVDEGRRLHVWSGAATGILAVLAAALVLRRGVSRLPLRSFFAVSGALLCGLAISFAGSGIYGLVASGYLKPRPVPFPEVAWMGIHPDATGLLVQLAIVAVIAGAALSTLRRRAAPAPNEP